MRLAIDLDGGNFSQEELEKVIFDFSKDFENIKFVLIGKKPLSSHLPSCSFIQSKSMISIKDSSLIALRTKKDSSIAIGIDLLKNKKVDTFISCGQTGALLSFSKLHLKMIPGIKRPALLTTIPSNKNPIAILDVGANLKKKAQFLTQWAILGSCYQNFKNLKNPKIGLLNIGSEEKKGSYILQKAYKNLTLLSQKNILNFVGNVEGKDVFSGMVDVLVTDGFTGNIFLKTSEGISNFILDKISSQETECKSIKASMNELENHLHYERYKGAILIGLTSLVIKCHRYSSILALKNAIKGSIDLLKNNFIESISINFKNYS